MRIDWKARIKNPYFWVGLGGVILTAIGAKPEMFTSWAILIEQLKILFGNPFLLGSVILAVIGVIFDPTTKGLGDNRKKEKSPN